MFATYIAGIIVSDKYGVSVVPLEVKVGALRKRVSEGVGEWRFIPSESKEAFLRSIEKNWALYELLSK